MNGIPTLATDRLVLRPFRLGDAGEVQCLAADRSPEDTTLDVTRPYLDGVAEQWISSHQGIFSKSKGVTLAITHKAGGVLLGAISLMVMEKGDQAELGYFIGRQYWNRGLCTEAGGAILKYAFSELGLVRVFSRHVSTNLASGRVLRKLRMRHEGTRRQRIKKSDEVEDLELYGMPKEEWMEKVNKPELGSVIQSGAVAEVWSARPE
jgi:RimJ/RimL family protein N-acetyltransferase